MTFQSLAILFLAWGTVDFAICYKYCQYKKRKRMKVGSLVECVDNAPGPLSERGLVERPELNKIYTVRAMVDYEAKGILLEEIINKCAFDGDEYGYNINRFRELQPPMDLSFIEEMQMTEQVKVLK